MDPEDVQLYYQIALQGRQDLPLAPDEHSGFCMTALRMLAFRPESGETGRRTATRASTGGGRAGASSPARAERPAGEANAGVRHGVAASTATMRTEGTVRGTRQDGTATTAREARDGPHSRPGDSAAGSGFSGDWPALVRRLEVTGAARELARNCELRRYHDGVFELLVPRSMEYLAQKAYQDKLRAALASELGKPAGLRIDITDAGGASVAALDAGDVDARRAKTADAVHGDQFVRDLIDTFDATVIESSIKPASGQAPDGH
jgi:DNA polymerase-3 subunit gamma/tau